MLHLNTINEITHETLLALQSKDYLQEFALVGGTNLSLRYGHRSSIDLDLFSPKKFDSIRLSDLLQIDFNYTYRSNNKHMLFCFINNVKVDWVHHPFGLLKPIEVIDEIKFFSVADVSAMKLFAVTKRGSKKDFFDIFQLAEILGPHKLVEHFSDKYGEDKIWMMQMSLIYFEDADKEEDPKLFFQKLSWNKVKKYMKQTFSKPL
jgi:predicted nucleotidyltransferase component of viral defense system